MLRRGMSLLAAGFLLLTVGALRLSADETTISLQSINTTGLTGPFATVTIDLTSSTTAKVTFDSDTNGGNTYLLGSTSAADLNINATTFTVSSVTETNSISGFSTPSGSAAIGSSNSVDGWGKFNLQVDNVDGFTHSATEISFTVTDTSGTWSSASDVLSENAKGLDVAANVFACTDTCSSTQSNPGGGFATTPEPVSMLLFGTGLLVVATQLRRSRR